MMHFLPVLALVASLAFAGEALRAPAHDFHVSYGRMAVEGSSVAVRLRFFSDDLQKAIRTFTADETATITDDPASWAPFDSYLSGALHLVADNDTLQAVIIGSGEDVMDKEAVRWFLVQYTASEPVRAVTLRNRLLFDEFDDQKNIVQFRHFPSEKNGSLYFTHDRSSYDLEF